MAINGERNREKEKEGKEGFGSITKHFHLSIFIFFFFFYGNSIFFPSSSLSFILRSFISSSFTMTTFFRLFLTSIIFLLFLPLLKQLLVCFVFVSSSSVANIFPSFATISFISSSFFFSFHFSSFFFSFHFSSFFIFATTYS